MCCRGKIKYKVQAGKQNRRKGKGKKSGVTVDGTVWQIRGFRDWLGADTDVENVENERQ